MASSAQISRFPAILSIAAIAGTLDITDNLIYNALRGITPAMVFRYIASGLIGWTAAHRGGMAEVALGVMLHYLIAFIWTVVFYVASRKLAVLTRRPFISGLLYGAFVYLFMNALVLPLSAIPHPRPPMSIAARVNAVLAVMIFIGLTISLLVRRWCPLRTPNRRQQ